MKLWGNLPLLCYSDKMQGRKARIKTNSQISFVVNPEFGSEHAAVHGSLRDPATGLNYWLNTALALTRSYFQNKDNGETVPFKLDSVN